MGWRRKDPLSLPICQGSLVLTSPAGRGAEVWERRVGLTMFPVGMGFGGPTPSVPAALAWPPGQRKPACPDSPCGSWSLQSCLPLPPPDPSLSVVPQKSPQLNPPISALQPAQFHVPYPRQISNPSFPVEQFCPVLKPPVLTRVLHLPPPLPGPGLECYGNLLRPVLAPLVLSFPTHTILKVSPSPPKNALSHL